MTEEELKAIAERCERDDEKWGGVGLSYPDVFQMMGDRRHLLTEVERLRGDAALGSLLREYSDATIEPLAALEHEQWAHWTAYMLSNLTPENINRWLRQIKTPYEQLSPREKNSDREWAEKVLIVLRAAQP